ncbi:MAG: VWA domain-containing protein, partial [Kiritimatiellaeota bacterium]|nr:VWA domain-containing protein [Kiritimatiellota bacterium]
MTFLLPIMFLLALPCAALWMLRRPPSGLAWMRAAVLALLVLALARPVARLPRRGGAVIVLADRSASLPAAELAAQEKIIGALASRRPADGKIAVVSFAEKAYAEHPPQAAPFKGFSAVHNPDASNLADTLALAKTIAPERAPVRALVLSDGRASGEIPRPSSFPIDYRFQSRRGSGDLAIMRVEAPQTLRPDEAMLATAFVSSPDEREIAYTLRRGAAVVAQGRRVVPRGISHLVFRDMPPNNDAAVAGYELRLESVDDALIDPIPENNTARFLVRVKEEKPLLHVAADLRSALTFTGVKSVPPEQCDFSLASLAGYSGVVLENVRADAIGSANLANIAAWVEHSGAGVLMTGGANSFGMGGYYKSPIEDILPVSMELRREHRKYSMAVVIVMDRSGSMGMPVAGGKTKMDMANLGCMEVLGLLSPQDEISVIVVDTAPHVILPMMSAGAAQAERGHIMAIQSMGGGIYVYDGLVAGLKELKKSSAGIRHFILFSDAADSEKPGDYRKLMAAATAEGITFSVIALGTRRDCDAELLDDIARIGGGTIAFSDDAREIPRLFAQDTITMSRNTLVEDTVAPVFTRALPLLSDTLPATAPPLGGYNLTYLVPDATAVAFSDDENTAPLVAFRPAGTGRAIVFTGETDGKYSGAFAKWEHAAEFHAALARWCAGPKDDTLPGLLVRQRLVPGGVEITAFVDNIEGGAHSPSAPS